MKEQSILVTEIDDELLYFKYTKKELKELENALRALKVLKPLSDKKLQRIAVTSAQYACILDGKRYRMCDLISNPELYPDFADYYSRFRTFKCKDVPTSVDFLTGNDFPMLKIITNFIGYMMVYSDDLVGGLNRLTRETMLNGLDPVFAFRVVDTRFIETFLSCRKKHDFTDIVSELVTLLQRMFTTYEARCNVQLHREEVDKLLHKMNESGLITVNTKTCASLLDITNSEAIHVLTAADMYLDMLPYGTPYCYTVNTPLLGV